MVPTAVVPARIGHGSKTRLAHRLTSSGRLALARELLDRVVEALLGCGLRVVVLTPSDLDIAGVEVWRDDGRGLNRALDDAVSRVDGPVLIVHADLPSITTSDVETVLAEDADVVIARAQDGGTNALLMRKPMRVAFGPRSALMHARRARRLGLSARVVDVAGLALDVDTAATLTASRSTSASSRRPAS